MTLRNGAVSSQNGGGHESKPTLGETAPASAAPRRTMELPVLQLPPKVPIQRYRKAQSNIPDSRNERIRFSKAAAAYVAEHGIVPPVPMPELLEHATVLVERLDTKPIYANYLAILVNNSVWRDSLAAIPYDRRLLLIPKCLRVEEHCPAPFDEFGLLCKECGLCSIEDLTKEADRLGYAVLVAEGSAIVRSMIETGKIEAIVGVSCINVLEKCFPHMEAAAVPGAAIPLLQDDCKNTTVDLDQVWDLIHLTSDDQTWRLDLDALKADVKSWFTRAELDRLLGDPNGGAEEIGRDWLAKDGNRWRPYLASCVYLAIQQDGQTEKVTVPDDFKRLAIAVECFHKASLIHDDIEDGDRERYGDPALHVTHGEAIAINVGDLLIGEGYRLLSELDVPATRRVLMMRIAALGHVTLSRGQGEELAWSRAPSELAAKDVLRIFEQKTAPAFQVALSMAAHYADADQNTRDVLDEYSQAIGIGYQVKDDLEDFDGSSDSNDTRDVRPSLLLAIAQKKASSEEDRALITDLVLRRRLYGEIAEETQRILRESGAIDKASELQNAYQEQAVRALRFLDNATLKGLLRRVVHKIFPQVLLEGYCAEFETRNAAGREAGAQSAR